MSNPVAQEATRRRLTAKQADTVDRLSRTALAVLRREGFVGLTIRMVAAEAGVGAATAYTYFSSKEHLVAEVFWRRLSASTAPSSDNPDAAERVVAVLRHIALLLADEPELAAAVTTALLGKDPDVEHLRVRIAFELHHRISAALGPAGDPDLVASLELLYAGALLQAGMGYASYQQIAELLERSARALLA